MSGAVIALSAVIFGLNINAVVDLVVAIIGVVAGAIISIKQLIKKYKTKKEEPEPIDPEVAVEEPVKEKKTKWKRME